MQTSSFYCHRGLFRSPFASAHSLHVYVEASVEAYANASSNSSTISPSCSYFLLSLINKTQGTRSLGRPS